MSLNEVMEYDCYCAILARGLFPIAGTRIVVEACTYVLLYKTSALGTVPNVCEPEKA